MLHTRPIGRGANDAMFQPLRGAARRMRARPGARRPKRPSNSWDANRAMMAAGLPPSRYCRMVGDVTTAELLLGSQRETGAPVALSASTLLRHLMALGSSGSGKTVFCKVVVEELVRAGIPTICVDPQGDLCSLVSGALSDEELRQRGVDPALAAEFQQKADVVIYTPASAKGVPLCADPVDPGLVDLPQAERLAAVTRTASMVTALLGFDVDGDDGAGLTAVLDAVLQQALDAGQRPTLASMTEALTKADHAELERYLDARKIRTACQRLARLDVGARKLLFHQGVPINIDQLLGRDAPDSGRTRVSVIYLNTLHGQEDKDFLVAALVDRLYAWMLSHPSSTPQLLFYIDEVSPFIPPVRKPACKDGLALLFKQARKYGVCCLMATQNPGDVDYRAMAQFGTWALGRLTTRQDLKKLEPTIKSIDPVSSDSVMGLLPSLAPGELMLLSPDNFSEAVPLKTRWLFTDHRTFDEKRIEEVADERWRERFTAPTSETSREPAVTDAAGAEEEPRPTAKATAKAERKPKPTADATAEAKRGPKPGGKEGPNAADPEMSTAAPRAVPKTVPMTVPLAAAPTRPQPAASQQPAVDPTEQALQAVERELSSRESAAVKELAGPLSMSDKKVRGLLKRLVSRGVVAEFKQGRGMRYHLVARGGRPDLGLPARVLTVTARINQETAASLARDHVRSRLLGLIGEDETLAGLRLVHRLLYKLDFREHVERGLIGRIVGGREDERLGSVYVHPQTLELLVLDLRAGIRFASAPDQQHAGDVPDLDGVAAFTDAAPSQLVIDEQEWLGRTAPNAVSVSFHQRYSARCEAVTPLFLPLWELTFQQDGGARYRVITLDALLGQPVSWPRPGEARN